jgi:hypothetical protein
VIITPPSRFQHAGELSLRVDSADPREGAIPEAELFVDLRPSAFVRPPASLWCTIYLLLARRRGIPCTLWVPTNTGVCIYLKSLGLFGVLQRYGVEVDDLGIRDREDSQLVLPLTRFDTVSEAEELTNKAVDALKESALGAANLYPVVSETFGELAMNAVEHADSPIGAYGVIQFYESEFGRRFVCGVADGGIGIRRSLEKNPELRRRVPQDWDAVKLATQERISGTGGKTRGMGLSGIADDMRETGRSLIVHSGIGSLQIVEGQERSPERTRLFPGTLVSASIPT